MNIRVENNLEYAKRALLFNQDLLNGYNWDSSDTGSERLRLELQGHRAELNKIIEMLEKQVKMTASPSAEVEHKGYQIAGIENLDKLTPPSEDKTPAIRLKLESIGLPVNHSMWALIFMKEVPKLSIGVMVHSQVPALVLQMSLEDLEKHTYTRRIKRYVDMTNEIYIERCKKKQAEQSAPLPDQDSAEPAKKQTEVNKPVNPPKAEPTVEEYRNRLRAIKFE